MLGLGSLAFASPWVLLGLTVVPVIWLLLRVTPPAPRRQVFPAIALLFGLKQAEETPARTPWWLILLRMVLATLVILALAHPLLNPGDRLTGSGPVLLVVDDGWAAAPSWSVRQRRGVELIDRAERDGRSVALLATARQANGEAPAVLGPQRAGDMRARLQALQPKPWPVERDAARQAVEQATGFDRSVEVVYLADGLTDDANAGFLERLQRLGSLRVLTGAPATLPVLLEPPESRPGDVEATLRRADIAPVGRAFVRALATDGRLLARQPAEFEAGSGRAVATIKLPVELRNALARLEVEGQDQSGGVVLLDEQWQRRPVGVISSNAAEAGQSLLEDGYYLDRALGPFAEVRRGSVTNLLKSKTAVLLMADSAPVGESDRAGLRDFIEQGGTLVRFAGPRLAEINDELVPVKLRQGDRTLGTALQWSQPAKLAPFDPGSPFAGLPIPDDVSVTREVLAEPSLQLAERSWARLADGTPLVTAQKRGTGWLVLFHVPANAEWSNLPLSGLFVEMLRRVVAISRGISGGLGKVALPPLETLDGFGHLQAASASANPLPAVADSPAEGKPPAEWKVDARHPPGLYGSEVSRFALNLGATVHEIKALEALPSGVGRGLLDAAGETDLKPWLLAGALLILMADMLIGLGLRGLLLGSRRRTAAAGILLALFSISFARAQSSDPEEFALKGTLETRLVYVQTGSNSVDDVSRAGLKGLTAVLNRRTAVEAAEPLPVDVETDELAFFPLIYWPVVAEQKPLSNQAIERVNFYLHNGGTILFDTRDETGGGNAGARRLQQLVRGIEIPPLIPVPTEHVLTKAFYLLQEFPGRSAAGGLWVENQEGSTDEVSSIIVGSNDYAGAWAIDANGRSMFAVSPGGEQQREMALRFGVNVVMYALTGNYKTDQVHVPSILERLGQ